MSSSSEVLGVNKQPGIGDCEEVVRFLLRCAICGYFRVNMPSMDSLTVINNNNGMYCTKKDSKQYFKQFLLFVPRIENSITLSIITNKCTVC